MGSSIFGSKVPDLPHLVRGSGGLAGEIKDLREDIEEAFIALEGDGGYLYTEEFINLATADADYFMTARASSASADTWTTSAATATAAWIAGTEMVPPRNATITSSSHGDIDAVACVITGFVRDEEGRLQPQTDTITLTNGGGVTNAGTKAFSKITSVAVPAQSGTGGTLTLGFGVIVGLAKPLKARNDVYPVMEIVGGVVASADYLHTEEWTNPATADVDYFMTSRPSQASQDIWTVATTQRTAAWLAGTEMVPPRNVSITSSSHVDIDAVACVVVGFVRDQYGKLVAQTDTITLTNGGGATDVGTKAFSLITSVTVPAQSGTGGALTLGFDTLIGFGRPIKTEAGGTAALREISGGTVVATGTYGTAAGAPPHGTYVGAQPPNGSQDYALLYMATGQKGTFVLPASKAPHGTYTPAKAPDGVEDYLIVYAVDPAI